MFRDRSTRKRDSLLLPLAAVVTLCFSAPSRAEQQVPFKGTFYPTILSATPVDAIHVRLEMRVNVRATLLGDARGPAFLILDVATFSFVGETTWAAENGDALFLPFAGPFIPTMR